MRYEKRGRIFLPEDGRWWARRYATVPTPLILDDVIRIWFASLDSQDYGRIGFVDLDPADPSRIVAVHPEPVLDLGELGAFDDSGVNPSCVVRHDGEFRMYYIGWQRCERVPYMLFSGMARSADGLQFTRSKRTPILDRTDREPFSRSAPFVMRDGERWRMWYWSCERWSVDFGALHYNNSIRHAVSSDGLSWESDDRICISPRQPDEYAVGRPWVIRDAGGYHMWFSARSFSKSYAISYARSHDGLSWERTEEDIIPRSPAGWDSDMVAYPSVVDVGERRYLFYNGNRHGESGFGYALVTAADRVTR